MFPADQRICPFRWGEPLPYSAKISGLIQTAIVLSLNQPSPLFDELCTEPRFVVRYIGRRKD